MIGIIPTTDALALLSPDADPEDGLDVADALDRKRQSPHYPALLEAIRRDGITVPVVIDFSGTYGELLDGHHRITAAHDAGLTSIPWTDDTTLADRIEALPWQLAPGTITPAAVEAFTRGACAGLAIALHDATGWPIIEVGHCDGLPLHFMVRHPSGQLLDIRGLHADEDVRDEWEFDADDSNVTLAKVARETVVTCYQIDCGEPVPMDLVRTFVPVLPTR